jgi:hypothetical protein
MLCYLMALVLWLEPGQGARLQTIVRWLWTLGCAAMLAHLAFAFQLTHHWSHAAALRETARQTEELFGWNWGGGVWANYLFAAWWSADVVWWWLAGPACPRTQPWAWTAALHGYLALIAFNAVAVFGDGGTRWCGVAGSALVAVLAARSLRRDRRGRPGESAGAGESLAHGGTVHDQ